MKPVIGYAGMTHLGLNSAAAAAERGFETVCFDPDDDLIEGLRGGELPVMEPGLPEALAKNKARLLFTSDAADLGRCGVVFIAPDVATGDEGLSDLSGLKALLDTVDPHIGPDAVRVILSQVPPGFTRARADAGHALYYQVETLIFGEAMVRALNPERFIVGCADSKDELPAAYRSFLDAFGCPILCLRYESAELAKIAINCFLVSQVSTTNMLAELCESIDADWSEIAPALRLDKRIGQDAYLKPGLGLAGGNLERDLATVARLAEAEGTDAGVVQAWVSNSTYRKLAAARILEKHVLAGLTDPVVAIWGLAYKENTHSTKNSPALATMAALPGVTFRVHDPVVSADVAGPNATGTGDPLAAAEGADALMILTPWPEYRDIEPGAVAGALGGRTVIDPYGVFDADLALKAGLDYYTLGTPPQKAREK